MSKFVALKFLIGQLQYPYGETDLCLRVSWRVRWLPQANAQKVQ